MSNIKKSAGHPAGLWVLFTTELWERFAFYSMRAILVLYLVSISTGDTPGFGWSEAEAYKLYAWYTSLVYLSPLIGGWFADRFIGARMCVVIGAVLMALGEFILAAAEFVRIGNVDVGLTTDPVAMWTFYIGLGVMILGNGFFKPCISTMVGQLYEPGDDRRRDAGFMIFYMGINIGAFMSPLVAGTIGEIYGYQYGFLIAGFGMVFGLISFLVWGKYLKGIGEPPAKKTADGRQQTAEEQKAYEKALYEQTRPLDRKDWDRIFVIFVLAIFVIAFWLAFEQAGSSLNIFAKRSTDRTVAASIQDALPEFLNEGLFLKNEDFQEFRALVRKVQVLSAQLDRDKDAVVEGPSFAERLRRFNIFRERQRDESGNLPIEEQIAAVKATAEELRRVLRTSNNADVQEAIETLNRVVEEAGDSFAGIEQYRTAVAQMLTTILIAEQGRYGEQIQASLLAMDAEERRFEEQYKPGLEPRTFPATWYQSVNPLYVVFFAPLFIILWNVLARFGIEPSTPAKFGLGLLLASAAFLMMIPGAIEAKYSGGKAAMYWLLLCFLLKTWGELCLSPIGLSMITKLSPARYVSQFMGLWFCASSLSYFLAGYAASYFGSGEGINIIFGEEGGLADFFLLIAIAPFIAGVIALMLAPTLKKKMHGIH